MASKIVAMGQPAQPATIGQLQALLDAFTAVTTTGEPPARNQNDPELDEGSGSFRCLETSQGALGGTRTPNLLIRSQMLYPLSYEHSN